MELQGRLGPQNAPTGAGLTTIRMGYSGDQLVSDLNPKWLEQNLRGNLFVYTSATTGVTMAALGNNLATWWNPSGSSRIFVPLRVSLGYVSTTDTPLAVHWGYQNNVGANIGTAAPISVFTDIAPVSGIIGGSVAANNASPRTRFATTCTITAAPTFYRAAGPSTRSGTAAAVTNPYNLTWDEDGAIVLMPGSILQLAGAIGEVAIVSMVALELPLPQ